MLLLSVTAAAGHGLPGRIGLANKVGQSPLAVEVEVSPEQPARGPVYIEVSRSPLQPSAKGRVLGTIVVSMAGGATGVAEEQGRVRAAIEEGRLLSSSEVNALEQKLQSNPHDWSARLSLLSYYLSSADLRMSKERIVAARRRHILWSIENRPAASGIYDMPELQMAKNGPLGDAEGVQQAEQAWQHAVIADSRNTQVLLNAASFSAGIDPAFAERLLMQAKSQGHDDAYWSRTLGWLYATAVVSGANDEFAQHALDVLNTSQNADLIAAAAPVLAWPTTRLAAASPPHMELFRPRQMALAEELALRAVSLEPDNPGRLLTLLIVLSVDATTAETDGQRVAAEKKMYGLFQHFDDLAADSGQRLHFLPILADLALDIRDDEAARSYANQALELASKAGDHTVQGAAVQGQAVHDANDVLGRVALRGGNLQEAKEYLLKAAAAPCGGTMTTIGPRMLLAQALLDRGERDTVLQYLGQMKTCWESGKATLEHWIAAIRSGKAVRLNGVDRPMTVSTSP